MTKSGTKNFSDLLIAKIFGILSTLNVEKFCVQSLHRYSYQLSLSHSYLMNPMKMRSL